VLSYYDHPNLEKFYPDWDRQVINITKNSYNSVERNVKSKKAKEVLLCNQRIENKGLF